MTVLRPFKLALWIAMGTLASQAVAVETKTRIKAQSNAVVVVPDLPMGHQEYSLPVSWQVTRARFDERGHSSDSESYQETWRLELAENGQAILHSPRDSVRVASLSLRGANPEAFTVSEADFARLTGLLVRGDAPPGMLLRVFTMHISTDPAGQDVTLDVADEEHLAVRVAVGPQKF